MVQFKTVKGDSFSLDLPETATIGEVKSQIEQARGPAFPKDGMTLIFNGKVLKDEAATLKDIQIAGTGFMVVMVKPKIAALAAPKPPAAASAPAAAATPAATPPAPAAAASQPAAETAAPAAGGSADAYSAAASELATGAALETKVSQICEMGFERAEVMKAMRAAYNNPERAVDYLMNGIPAGLEQQQQAAAAAAAAGAQTPPPSGAPPAGAAAPSPAVSAPAGQQPPVPAAGPNAQPLDMFPQGMPGIAGVGGAGLGGRRAGALQFLRQNPQFQALRQLVQVNPQILQPMLQELGKQNPQLLQQINNNQEEFLQMINEPVEGGLGEGAADLLAQMGGAGAFGGEDAAMGEGEVPANQVRLTQEEAAAVQRLQGLGFSEGECLEAYLACDKNEDYAANYLLEHGGQED